MKIILNSMSVGCRIKRNLTLIGLGLNRGVQGDRQATSAQSHGKANGKDNTDPQVSIDLKGGGRISSYP